MEAGKSYVSALDMLKEESGKNPIFTFSQALDGVLNGGIYLKMLTEIFGTKALGKTTLCLQLALNVQVPKSFGGLQGECLFIDTENSFFLNRLNVMAERLVKHLERISLSGAATSSKNEVKPTVESFVNGIHYFNCRSTEELEELVQSLNIYFTQHPEIRLVIIDSLAFLFYSMSSDFDTRTKILYSLARDLRRLMNKFNLAIVVTNSMTTRFGQDGQEYHIPYLGESWTYVPNRRIQLDWNGNSRSATLVKCPATKPGSAVYRINSAGIRD